MIYSSKITLAEKILYNAATKSKIKLCSEDKTCVSQKWAMMSNTITFFFLI